MKFRVPILIAVLSLAISGCATLDTKKLSRGMSESQLVALWGNPKRTYSGSQGGRNVAVWDYAKDGMGIPNPLDDYAWIFPPTTKVVRLWIVNGKLNTWKTAKVSSLEAIKKLDGQPEWRTPPVFNLFQKEFEPVTENPIESE